MNSNKRPYLKNAIDSLRGLFYKNTSNLIVLRNIMHELIFRKTDKAKKLTKDVRDHIGRTFGAKNDALKDIEAELSSIKIKKPKKSKNQKTEVSNLQSYTLKKEGDELQNPHKGLNIQKIQSNYKKFDANPVSDDLTKAEALQKLLSSMTLKDFVSKDLSTVRVKNSILAEDDVFIGFNSVYSFITASDKDRRRLKRLQFFGEKSLSDLVSSIESYIERLNKGSLSDICKDPKKDQFSMLPPVDEKIRDGLSATQSDNLKKISLEFFVGSCSMVSVRTRNAILNSKGQHGYLTLYDFFVTPTKCKKSLLNLSDFGKTSLNNLIQSIDFLIIKGNELSRLTNIVSKTNDIQVHNSIDELIDYAISSVLEEKARFVIERRYLGMDTLTLQEVGESLSISRERVRQIESKSMEQIRAFILSLPNKDPYLKFRLEFKDYLFESCDFSSIDTARNTIRNVSKSIDLYIRIFGKSLEAYLNEWFFYSDKFHGWFVSEAIKNECESNFNFKKGLDMNFAIQSSQWPVSLARLSIFIGLPECVLKDMVGLSERFYIENLQNGTFVRPRKITTKNAVRYVLRRYQRGMSLDEIQDNCIEMFDLKISIGNIGNTLGELPDGLIVNTGTYALYEYLNITSKQLTLIRNICNQYLIDEGRYVSAFVVFNNLKKENNFYEKYGDLDNGHMLFGICQDDDRFITKRGFMLGLVSSNFKGEYLTLTQEVIDLMKKECRPLSIKEIIEKLSDTRCLIWSSIFGMLDNDKHGIFEKVGGDFYLSEGGSIPETSDEDFFEIEFDEI